MEKKPAQARELLAAVIEPALLTPGPEGYEIALTLKNETAALASGRPVFDAVGCGGVRWSKPDLLAFALALPSGRR